MARNTMSWLPVVNTRSSAWNVQKFGMTPRMYFQSSAMKNEKRGRKKTLPSILKIANAWILLFARLLTINAKTGANKENRIAIGRKSANDISIKPERAGNVKTKMKQRNSIRIMR